MSDQFLNHIFDFMPKLLSAVVICVIGLFILKILNNFILRGLKKSKIDQTVRIFLISLSKIVLYLLLIITVLSAVGVNTNSLLAILGALGVGISLAVKDSLSHLAGGILILFAKPIMVGDFIELNSSVKGRVKSITILYTQLNTVDNKVIYIPNGKISSDLIINYSKENVRRLDLVIGISYKSDFEKAKQILRKIVDESNLTLKKIAPIINVMGLSDSSVDIAVRVWTKTENYIELEFELYEKIKTMFDQNGIEIPFNQLDVNLNKN